VKIASISLRGIKGLADTEVRFGPPDAGAPFVVTGPTASGKTRFLEVIAAVKEQCGSYGRTPDARSFADPSRPDAAAEVEWHVPEDLRDDEIGPIMHASWSLVSSDSERLPIKLRERLGQWSPGSGPAKFEYFHAGRLGDVVAWRPRPVDRVDDRVAARMLASPGKYDWVRAYLAEAARRAAEQREDELIRAGLVLATSSSSGLEGFSRRLSSLTDRLEIVSVRHEGATPLCWFARPNTPRVELSELSMGEQAMVLFAAAFERIGLDGSVVLVDSPELFIHPEDHLRVFEALSAWTASGQLIVATTSPSILRAVPHARVLVLR